MTYGSLLSKTHITDGGADGPFSFPCRADRAVTHRAGTLATLSMKCNKERRGRWGDINRRRQSGQQPLLWCTTTASPLRHQAWLPPSPLSTNCS